MFFLPRKSCGTVALSSALLFSSYGISTTASADVMLGASLPSDGFSRQIIADFNNVIPKDLAYVNVFSAFSHDWDNLYWQSLNVVSEGATPMISWMPIDLQRPDDNLLPEIAIGMWDDYLDLWGTKLIAWVNSYPETDKPRLAIRFAHEFNGNWYPYSNTPIAYSAAWQHIHDKFEAMGVNQHVDWVWSASKTNVDDYDDFSVYYPGDAYVDWTSLDGYNWGSNYRPDGWSSFGEIFNNAYLDMVENFPDKPIMIAETGSAEPSDLPNVDYGMYGDNSDAGESKSEWIAGMLSHIESEYPAVRALSLFNINKELGWAIHQEIDSGLDAWIEGTQSPHYTSELIVASEMQTTEGMHSIAVFEQLNSVEALTEIQLASASDFATTSEPASVFDDAESSVVAIKNDKRSKNKKKTTTKSSTQKNVGITNLSQLKQRPGKQQKRIDSDEQRELAKSKKPKRMNPEKGRLFSEKLRNLTPKERKKFRKLKMSVLDY